MGCGGTPWYSHRARPRLPPRFSRVVKRLSWSWGTTPGSKRHGVKIGRGDKTMKWRCCIMQISIADRVLRKKRGLSVEGLLQLDDVLLSWGLVVPFWKRLALTSSPVENMSSLTYYWNVWNIIIIKYNILQIISRSIWIFTGVNPPR